MADQRNSGRSTEVLTPVEQLGKFIFFDTNLSINSNQSCAACHTPEVGWTGPVPAINAVGAVYEGSISGRFGNRKPPSSAYATSSPILHYVIEKKEALFIGGNFWDGRASGEKLGNPAADQAQGPFLNPLEQALPAPADVVSRVCGGSYGALFRQVWGNHVCEPNSVSDAYDKIALSIAAFEASPESNAFTSKYDYYLKGMVDLTERGEERSESVQEQRQVCEMPCLGFRSQGVLCSPILLMTISVCRVILTIPSTLRRISTVWVIAGSTSVWGNSWRAVVITSNLHQRTIGKQKVPTLRNVDKRPYEGFAKAYTHNGYFKSLKAIVHFYNTRDAKPACVESVHWRSRCTGSELLAGT